MKKLDEELQKEEEMAEYKKKCLLCICITMILISLAVATVISMAIMALILMAYRNKQEEICQPMQVKTSSRLLSNGEISEVIPPENNRRFL
jgi:flagellar basal body-associated protein FliL